jgi:hypothetical protein
MFFLKSKEGNEIHSTRYPTREAANVAAFKISRGLIKWNPTINAITNRTNFSNQA